MFHQFQFVTSRHRAARAATSEPVAHGSRVVRLLGSLAVSLAMSVPLAVLASAASPSGAGALVAEPQSCRGPGDFGAVFLGHRWPGGFKGVPVYSNGVSGSFTDCLHTTRTPSGKVVVDGYMWQCVELVDRLYLAKGWISSAWLGNGNQLFSTAPHNLHKQAQGHITHVGPGDVVSFDAPGGGYGHSAVISRVTHGYITIVNQNTDRENLFSHAWLRGGRIVMVGWAGWRPLGVVDAP